MSNLNASLATPSGSTTTDFGRTSESAPMPILRVPMLDSDRQLFAYEIIFHRNPGDEKTLLQDVLSIITDGALSRLVRGNRTFLNLPAELLPEDSDILKHQPRIGLVLQPGVAHDAALMKRLKQMSERDCPLMLDASDIELDGSIAVEALLQIVQSVRLDANRMTPERLRECSEQLHARGLWVIAGQVNDHQTYQHCLGMSFRAIQGRYLLIPEPTAVPVLTANRLSMLRLMRVMQESNPGPVEIGNIVRDDAILSYKLLSCVNSAYFALPRQLKSVQHAAIFFGVSRMRNWVDAMALCGMDDRPPELLRAALIRAKMCEKLAAVTPGCQPDMAFTVGLFSLLDTLMCAPMEFLLTHLHLAPEISRALTGEGGPFGSLLEKILAWEAGKLTSEQTQPQVIQRMAAIYLEAMQWADQVYASSTDKPAS
jgi:EAL and modified HD-GYP domain-containing signal transduction protein